ncbi:penicillin-binding transpeptidase domain-containing protein [Legionella sp. km772]|uniref:penicillin-binding transpeptidase domain-containing protein n=1 Tax=Legionella sp. km772 TaxID=2498111 RepID=UPI000F8CC311|nr:penicillin-binding transpeptidase domain-containing protein [Legionella sp. km772]RUR06807.1 class D beta-lactamase [Legionella sp. km772]
MKIKIGVFLAITAFNAMAHEIAIEHFAYAFKNFNACFMLYDVNKKEMLSEYNPGGRCSERLAPDSTFKIPLSLMAFNQGLINQKTEFKWNGKNGELAEWNQDQTPQSWFTYSVVWVSQQLTQELQLPRIKHYLDGFNYGNKDFTGDPGKNNGLAYAWLSSSLKISANEQLNFLTALSTKELPLSPDAVNNTINNMYLGKLDNGFKYYGKTGSGRHGRNERETNPSRIRDGWFVGLIEGDKGQKYVFVTNLTDKTIPPEDDKAYGSRILKPIALNPLNTYFKKDN